MAFLDDMGAAGGCLHPVLYPSEPVCAGNMTQCVRTTLASCPRVLCGLVCYVWVCREL